MPLERWRPGQQHPRPLQDRHPRRDAARRLHALPRRLPRRRAAAGDARPRCADGRATGCALLRSSRCGRDDRAPAASPARCARGAVASCVCARWPSSETTVALVAPSRAPTDADWAAAARDVRAGFRPGDLIVAAPAWADPIMRLHLGDLIPPAVAARMDDARFARVWEVSQRGAHAPEAARGTVARRRAVRRAHASAASSAPPRPSPTTSSRTGPTPTSAARRRAAPSSPARWRGDRFRARRRGNNCVRRQLVEVDTKLRRGAAHAAGRRTRRWSSSSPPCRSGASW